MNKIFGLLAAMAVTSGVFAQTVASKKDSTVRQLNEVNVTSKYYKKYKIDRSSNSLKLVTPVLELPQNIQAVDKSILIDQQSINVNESVTRNVSGTIRNNTADFYGPFIFMRGAAINTLRNGMDVSMIYYGPTPEDIGIMDRIEFIKGPAGFVNSIGDPAGSFNVVTKQPSGITSNSLNFTTGSFNLYRLSADLDGHFDTANRWQYRLNVIGQKAKSFQKFAFNDKILVDPNIKYNINSHSFISAEYIYQQQQFEQYLLTVFTPNGFASMPKDFSIADPAKKPVNALENNGFLTYHNRFSNNWQLNAKAMFVQDNLDGNYFFVSAYDKTKPTLIPRRVTYEKFRTNVYALQAFVNGNVQTGAFRHQMLTGIDVNRKKLLAYSGYNDKKANQTLYPLDVNNPVYGINFDPNVKQGALDDIATNKSSITYYAGYFQDEISTLNNRIRLTLAARLTSAKSIVAIPTVSSVTDLVLTPRIGLSYSLVNDFNIYMLFDHTYTPQSGISATGGVFDPLKGKNVEAGLKKDWANGKWNTTLSVYHITRDNVIVTDPLTNLQSQIGQTKSKGIEFDLKGEILKGLNAVINYAYTDSYISADANKNLIGLSSPYRVKHIQNTWLNYKLPITELKGITVSGGYQLQTGRFGRYPQDGDIKLAPIFRVDAGLGWANEHYSINAIVNNLLNRFNYGSAWTRPVGLYAYVPYPPREFRVSIGYNF